MPTVALKAHYDGERIVLDEPFDLPHHSPLMVTVLPETDVERSDWEALAVESLARAYGGRTRVHSRRHQTSAVREGDIVLAALPQANGQVKPRPAVLLRRMPPYNDWLVCGVSTQLHQQASGFDELIVSTDPDFASSGLKASSIIRLGFLVTLPPQRLLGVIGSISGGRHQRLLQRLAAHVR